MSTDGRDSSRDGMQAAAVAHPNIALVKYWGKADESENLPAVGSLSITLDTLTTTTTVRFDESLSEDQLSFAGRREPSMVSRVSACLDDLRRLAGSSLHAEVTTDNDCPTAAGLASSASGFAALVTAADAALGLGLARGELARVARRASGSAARSLFGGFVELSLVDGGLETETQQLADASDWPMRVVVAVTSTAPKAVGSTAGMLLTEETSPFYAQWVATSPADLLAARCAVEARDFEALAAVSEASCLKMHAVMLAAQPGLVYWNGATVDCIRAVRDLRASGVPVFFTIDAGPQVKAVCLPEACERVRRELQQVPGVRELLECGLGDGARVA
jgi:diphosphomevalonate decarboxylase